MNMLDKLGLGEKEQQIIFSVLKYSLIVSVVVVISAWTIQYTKIKAKEQKQHQEKTDPTLLYEKKSKDLLPVDIEAHTFVIDHYLKNDQPERAIDHILRIFPAQPNNQDLKFKLASAYLASEQYDKALTCFEQIAKSESDTSALMHRVLPRMGITLFYLGKINESILLLDSCIIHDSQNAEALCFRGEVSAAVSTTPAKAEEYFQKALHSDSSYVEAGYQLARSYMNHGDYVNARLCLLKIIESEPLHIRAHSRLGMVYYYLDQPELAKKSYLTAIALNPGDYNTHYNLGELYYTKFNDVQRALDEFKICIAQNPSHSGANFRIGLICQSNNMEKEAITYFNKALATDPKNIRIMLQLGVSYEKLSLRDDAIRNYSAIITLDPLNRIAQQKLKLLNSSQ